MNTHLIEYAAVSNGTTLRIDRTTARLRGVKILGLRSTNGREYSAAALTNAIGLYDGAKVNVNHPKGATTTVRDYQDRIGHLSDVRFEENEGLFGDLSYNPKHPLAEQLLWDAEHAPQRVGLSHNVLARTTKNEDRLIVEEIVKVFSVDLVADPATTLGLFESEKTAENTHQCSEEGWLGSSSEANPQAFSTSTWGSLRSTPATQGDQDTFEQKWNALDSQPLTIDSLTEQLASRRATIEHLEAELEAARTDLRTAHEQLRISQQTIRAKDLLAEFGLPDPTFTESKPNGVVDATFFKQVVDCEDLQEMRQLVSNRARLIAEARDFQIDRETIGLAAGFRLAPRLALPSSKEQDWRGGVVGSSAKSSQDFVAAIKRE